MLFNQKGTLLILLLIIGALVLISVIGGFYYLSTLTDIETPTSKSVLPIPSVSDVKTGSSDDTFAAPKTTTKYKNDKFGLQFEYDNSKVRVCNNYHDEIIAVEESSSECEPGAQNPDLFIIKTPIANYFPGYSKVMREEEIEVAGIRSKKIIYTVNGHYRDGQEAVIVEIPYKEDFFIITLDTDSSDVKNQFDSILSSFDLIKQTLVVLGKI